MASEADGLVRLTLEDGGPGVPPEALPRLFDKFYRVPGTPRGSRTGTGIGLAVVRGLVEAMGGSVIARQQRAGRPRGRYRHPGRGSAAGPAR